MKMHNTLIIFPTLAALASAVILPRQAATTVPVINFNAIMAAPTPSAVGPSLAAVTDIPTDNPSSVAASGSNAVTATATPTANAKLRRGKPGPGQTTTAPTSNSASSTVSSSTACPTTPEAGTYCGFINPEDPCAVQPDGYGPKVTPDTTAAFLAYAPFHQAAQTAKTPKGWARTFVDLNASSQASSYLGLYTLQTYDPLLCSQHCTNTTLCTAFNLYVERDPSLNPSANCILPASMTSYKCTLFGSSLSNNTATNVGGWRGAFQVVITASNGYTLSPVPPPAPCDGWAPPKSRNGGAVVQPSKCMGQNFFPGPYDPRLCAAYGQAQTAFNKAGLQSGQSYSACNMFNSYMVSRNGVPMGTFCSLFTDDVAGPGSWIGGASNGFQWGVDSSWSYVASVVDDGVVD